MYVCTSDVELMSDGGESGGMSSAHFARVVAAVFSLTVCTVAPSHYLQLLYFLL